MPALSCCCPEIIEKEGLVYYLREYLAGVARQAYSEGMTAHHLSAMLKQFITEAITQDTLPAEYILDREPTIVESFVISSTMHMIDESRLAGYNARAFEACIKDALTNGR